MKTKKTMFNCLVLAGMILIFISCAKDGAMGPSGTNGTNGTNGNVNIQNFTFTVTPSQWQVNSPQLWLSHNLTIPEITQSIMDSGLVMVYASVFSLSSTTQPLPISWYGGNETTLSVGVYYIGTVELDVHSTDLSYAIGTYYFRVVIASAKMLAANPNLNWNNYDEVKTTFNIKD